MSPRRRKTAVGYARVSTEEQHDSIADQRRRIEAWARAFDHRLSDVLADEGVSGAIPLEERPAGSQVFTLPTPADVLVVTRLDRLARDVEDGLRILAHFTPPPPSAARRTDPPALVVLDEHIDLTSAFGRFAARLRFDVAHLERELIGERTSAALRHRRATNRPHGATPYGWDRDGDVLVPNEVEQQLIEEMVHLRRSGLSDHHIAQRLNAGGVPTKTGNGARWYATTVFKVLRRAEELAATTTTTTTADDREDDA